MKLKRTSMSREKVRRICIALIMGVFFILGTLFFQSLTIVQATDLPIDMEAITRPERPEITIVPRGGIDLFSESATKVSERMAENHRISRERAKEGLFNPINEKPTMEKEEYLLQNISTIGLFAEGIHFREGRNEGTPNAAPIWPIGGLFAACGLSGAGLARAFQKRAI